MYSFSSKVRFLLTSTIFSFLSITTLLAQEPASGTIKFQATNTSGSVDVELVGAQAQSLQTSSIYNINGMTNEAIPFNWEVLGIEEFAEVYGSYINPSSAFDGVFSNPLGSTFEAGVYNLLGQRISTPEVTYYDNQVSIYDGLENVTEGMYVVALVGSNGESESICFIKKDNSTNKQISTENDNELRNQNPFGQRMADNYNIIWDDGYGVEAGSQSVTINAGSGNVINVTTSTLENPYYTVNADIIGGYEGTATYDTDDGEQYSAPINNGLFSLTNIDSYFEIGNTVFDISGDLTLTGTWGTFETIFNLTDDGEGEIIVDAGTFNVGGSSGYGNILIRSKLDGITLYDFYCNITNSETSQSYEGTSTSDPYVMFLNLPIATLPSDTYNGYIEDMEPDPRFLPTSFSVDIEEGTNPTHVVDVIPFPSEQDIYLNTVNTSTLAPENGVLVRMYNDATGAEMDNQISSGGGVLFEDVPAGTDVYFSAESTGSSIDMYKTTRGVYSTPAVIDRESKLDTLLHYSVRTKIQYDNGDIVPAADLMSYKPIKINVAAIIGGDDLYLDPSDPFTAIQKTHIANFEVTLGMEMFKTDATTPFGLPSGAEIDAYQIFEPNRNTLIGIVGSDLDSAGTSTIMQGKTADNGEFIHFYSSSCALGTDQENSNHHILTERLLIPAHAGPSATNPNPNESTTLSDKDVKNIFFWYEDATNTYDRYDADYRRYNHAELKTVED